MVGRSVSSAITVVLLFQLELSHIILIDFISAAIYSQKYEIANAFTARAHSVAISAAAQIACARRCGRELICFGFDFDASGKCVIKESSSSGPGAVVLETSKVSWGMRE